jgi:hypothetical protein
MERVKAVVEPLSKESASGATMARDAAVTAQASGKPRNQATAMASAARAQRAAKSARAKVARKASRPVPFIRVIPM